PRHVVTGSGAGPDAAGVAGRAESVRTAARTLGEFAAPLSFGYASSHLFTSNGLRWTFLVCLSSLVLAGLLGIFALRTYPRDVAAVSSWRAPAR
ncbi:hypothetical protein, partial [Actinacidiphila acidipaludis]